MSSFLNFLKNDSQANKDLGLLILRVVFGFVLLYGHGFEKMGTVFGGGEIQFFDPFGIGANTSYILAMIAEGICAILLILGLFWRIPALILSINFLFIFIFHAFQANDGFAVLELRYLYLFGFVALFFLGNGKYALDNVIFKKDK